MYSDNIKRKHGNLSEGRKELQKKAYQKVLVLNPKCLNISGLSIPIRRSKFSN